MKKKYGVFFLGLLVLICLVFIIIPKKSSTKAQLSINGKVVKQFDLTQQDFTENFSSYGANITIQVKNGQIRVLESDCPDKICVHTGFISDITQTAVCMPNKAVLEIIE